MRVLTIALLIAACGDGERDEAADLFEAFEAARAGEPIAASTRLGEAVATVRLSPGEPRLGDVLYLELEVTAPEGVDLVMPAFGEALGRFSIDDFDRRRSPGQIAQLYQLQAQMSGRMRIPSLRIEVDGQELLTDELAVDVAPIEDAPAELVAGPGTIDVPAPPLVTRWWVWVIAGVLAAGGFGLLLFWWRGRAVGVARASAYERAIAALEVLETAGLPEADEIDAWYVELSSVVRHYLEERFRIRAPELTTEEFLREAGAALSTEHRELLGEFLAGCDRVKFARHEPTADEMNGALSTALAFVKETRPDEVREVAA